MSEGVHPVVELLAKRMESHPEEFRIYDNSTLAVGGRWETWISQMRPYLNDAEREMLLGKSREVFLQRVHEEVLDELLNGAERRETERLTQRNLAQAIAQQQAAQLYNNQYNNQYANALRVGTQPPYTGLGLATAGQPSLNILKTIKRKVGL